MAANSPLARLRLRHFQELGFDIRFSFLVVVFRWCLFGWSKVNSAGLKNQRIENRAVGCLMAFGKSFFDLKFLPSVESLPQVEATEHGSHFRVIKFFNFIWFDHNIFVLWFWFVNIYWRTPLPFNLPTRWQPQVC